MGFCSRLFLSAADFRDTQAFVDDFLNHQVTQVTLSLRDNAWWALFPMPNVAAVSDLRRLISCVTLQVNQCLTKHEPHDKFFCLAEMRLLQTI